MGGREKDILREIARIREIVIIREIEGIREIRRKKGDRDNK